jgi:hypothetical protein
MKNVFLVILVGIVVAAVVFFTIQENQKPKEKVDLQLRLKAGEHHEMKLTKSQEIFQQYKNKVSKVKSSEQNVLGFDVTSVDPNGRMNISFYYKSVAFDINSPAIDIHYNSAKPPVESNDMYLNAISEVTSAVLANKFSTKISQVGDIGDIQGFENVSKYIEKKIRKEAAAKLNDPNMSQKNKELLGELQKKFLEAEIKEELEFYRKLINSVLSDTREVLKYIFIKYPYRPVATESKWHDKTSLDFDMAVDANITYIYKKKENGLAYIDSVYDIDMNKKLKIMEVTSRATTSKYISGVRSATNLVNTQTGLLQKSEARIKFSGLQHIETDKTVLPIRPNMDIDLKVEGTNTIELIK